MPLEGAEKFTVTIVPNGSGGFGKSVPMRTTAKSATPAASEIAVNGLTVAVGFAG